MAFRWDLLPQTSTTLQRDRAPTTGDATAWYPIIWVYTAKNQAWLLKDGTIQSLPPTTGDPAGVNTSAALSELEAALANIQEDYMKKVDYDTDEDNIVDEAESIDGGSF